MNKQIYPLLPHLNHLDLGENDIPRLEKDEFQDLQSLKHLKLDGNKLKHIGEYVFSHLSELKKLTLARNEIESISLFAFEDVDNLTELDLSYNRMNALKPHLFDSIRENLLVLSLSGNPLDLSSTNALLKNSKLRDLKLRRCKLFDIPENIFPSTLISLDLSENYLSSLSGYVLPEYLYYLDISKNMFRGISNDDFLDKIETINVTLLDTNPWSCDLCFIIPLLNRINRTASFRNIICSQPYVVEGKTLETLDRNQLTWCSSTSYPKGDANFFSINQSSSIGIVAAGLSVCFLFLILLVIAGMLCYSKRHAAKYYTHEDKLSAGNDFAENHSPLFCDDRELSFKFPLDNNVNEKRVSIATIDEMKKEHKITN